MSNNKAAEQDNSKNGKTKKTAIDSRVYIIFISLLLDLLAFTIILPLLPSLLEYYRLNDKSGYYSWLLDRIQYFRILVGAPEHYSSVLFGGFLGSMFSFLQFVASPIVGGMSDVLGRKKVMIVCLIGIALSYVLWALSNNIVLFIIARFIGGISKGNVSLSMAIITDISTIETRGIGMTLVGIAFSLGFIIGPLIGAVFAAFSKTATYNWFVTPALFAFTLAATDLIFFTVCFNETLPENLRERNFSKSLKSASALIDLRQLFQFKPIKQTKAMNISELKILGVIYFVYLFIYSGLEFTITFLTHHVFHYSSMQQGWMFFSIGLIMAIIQGGYVRRIPFHKSKSTAVFGLWLIVPSFVCLGLANNFWLLYFGLFLFAVSTALVVPCLMTMASSYGSPQQKGSVMGIFRSLGALARALGPIFASIAFWSLGARTTYLTGAIGLVWPALKLMRHRIQQ